MVGSAVGRIFDIIEYRIVSKIDMSEDLLCLIRYDDFNLIQLFLTNSPVFSYSFGE